MSPRLTILSQQTTEDIDIGRTSGIRAHLQHLCGDDLDLTIDSFSGSVPLGLGEGSMLKALLFVSIVLKLSLSDILSPPLCI